MASVACPTPGNRDSETRQKAGEMLCTALFGGARACESTAALSVQLYGTFWAPAPASNCTQWAPGLGELGQMPDAEQKQKLTACINKLKDSTSTSVKAAITDADIAGMVDQLLGPASAATPQPIQPPQLAPFRYH